MFEANRWHSDPLYQAPMAIVGEEHVFLGNIVHLQQENRYAKVRKFLTMVRLLIQLNIQIKSLLLHFRDSLKLFTWKYSISLSKKVETSSLWGKVK